MVNTSIVDFSLESSAVEGQCGQDDDKRNINHSEKQQNGDPLPTSITKAANISLNNYEVMPSQQYPLQPSESSPLFQVNTGAHLKCGDCLTIFKRILKSVVRLFFPSWTFTKFFGNAIIPPLADNLVPLFFIGNIPDESALALAAQFMFISIIVEVIQEGIVNSLFHYVGRHYKENRTKSLQALKICLAILLFLGGILTVFMVFLTPQFVNLIDTPESIADATKHFLYWSSFTFPLFLVNAALSNYLLITTSSYIVIAQLTSVVISFVCNALLFGQQGFSFHWSVEQLGYYKIIQTSLTCLNSFVFCLLIEKIGPFHFICKIPLTRNLQAEFKDLFHVSWGNFGDSATRNFFYFVVTLKFINNLGETEIAAWNLLNSIVWGLLLIPSFTVANYAKVMIGHEGNKRVIRNIARESFKCLTGWLILVSLISYFLWPQLAAFFGKSNEDAQSLSTKMFHEIGWIFIVFSLNNAMDSLFIGVGKTEYVFYQSLLTNLIVYCIPWLLYLFKVIEPSYWLVLGLYVAGMLVDFGWTAFFSFRVWEMIPEN